MLTDDQRADAIDRMPAVRELLVRRGVSFANSFVSNPLCCPSRATLLTGLHSHATGVWSNRSPHGSWTAFRRSGAERRTIAVALRRAGYRTGLIGKYMNHYVGPTVPPGWDDWRAFSHGWGYYDYALNVNGRRVAHGRRPEEYSTDVLARMATRFVSRSRKPFFLLFAPAAAHYPATAAPRHVAERLRLRPFAPPSFLERGAKLRDKPRYVREGWLWPTPSRRAFRPRQYRALLAVDDAVRRIVRALRRSGRLRNTVIVFTSDNGVMWNEHGFAPLRKAVPYEGAIRVPLIVRHDAGAARRGRVERRLVTNLDIAPTVARLARVRFPAHGRSLVPLLRGREDVRWRTSFLIQNMGGEHRGDVIPTWCGVRTEAFAYVVYATGEEELYDLALDPYQLENVATAAGYAKRRSTLRGNLRRLCVPRPPGFDPPGL